MAKIMIVDDSIVMRKNLSNMLEGAGHEVVGEATNGRQAVTLYQELQPDVVTMDISMPILSGVEAVRRIIEKDPLAKIVMISAVNQKKMVFNAINEGAKHYVVKPIETQKVLSIIDEVLEMEGQAELDTMDEVQGFAIENVDGTFIIAFNDHLDRSDHKLLETALNGILFVKPLQVVMDFTQTQDLSDQVVDPIIDLAKKIRKLDGQVAIKADQDIILNKIKAW